MLFVSCRARLFLVAPLLVGLSSAILRADTAFDSGTTTISTGTYFGTNLFVGVSGTAIMEIVEGGNASNDYGILGYYAGSVGVANVTSGTWVNARLLTVGSDGTGTLNVSGGYVRAGSTILGHWLGSVGIANITGGTWVNISELTIGDNGTGRLNISGGYVSDMFSRIGRKGGTATITGGTWATTDVLYIGYFGSGTMSIAGGYVSNANAHIGEGGGNGMVTVSGGSWANSSDLSVGASGTGTMNVHGGYVSDAFAYLGLAPGSVGVATVTGGTWASDGSLFVGVDGTGTLNVIGTGLVTVGGTVSQGVAGTINMGSGSQLTAAQVILAHTTSFTGNPSDSGFGTIAAAFGLTYGGVLGLHFGKFYDEGSYSLFSFTSLTPSGGFSSLFSTGTSGGSVYDSISFTSNGSGLWSGMASNRQMLSFNESSGVLSFSAVPESSAAVMALAGLACGGFSTSRRRRGLPVWGPRGGRRPGEEACPA